MINVNAKMLDGILKNKTSDCYMMTDISGMTVVTRDSADGIAIHFQLRTTIDGKRKVFSLGKYPKTSITDARTAYLKLKADLINGTGIFDVKKKEKAVLTIGDLWQKFIDIKFAEIKEKTKEKYLSIWTTHISKIKDVKITDITPKYIMEFIQPVVGEGKFETANKIATTIRALLDYAVFMEELEFNPLVKITKYIPSPKRQHHATFSDDTMDSDLKKLFEDMSTTEKNVQLLMYMYFFTLLRSVELRTLKTDDIYGDYITVKTKTLEKFKQPLTKQALKVIDYMLKHKKSHNHYVFEGMAELGYLSENTLNKALTSRGYKNKLRCHGIRSVGRQWLTKLPNVKESIIELCLAHTVGSQVQQAYNRGEYIEEKRKALQAFSDYIEEMAGDNFTRLFEE